MRDNLSLDEGDEGKTVISADGDQLGRVTKVEHGKAYVDPDSGMTDAIRTKLGWGHDEENCELDTSTIEDVSDDEIRLSR